MSSTARPFPLSCFFVEPDSPLSDGVGYALQLVAAVVVVVVSVDASVETSGMFISVPGGGITPSHTSPWGNSVLGRQKRGS